MAIGSKHNGICNLLRKEIMGEKLVKYERPKGLRFKLYAIKLRAGCFYWQHFKRHYYVVLCAEDGEYAFYNTGFYKSKKKAEQDAKEYMADKDFPNSSFEILELTTETRGFFKWLSI